MSNEEVTLVKVSDKFLTSADDAFGSTIKIMVGGVEQTLDVPDESIQIEDDAILVYEGVISINDAPHVLKGIGTIEYNGIYFMTANDMYMSGFKTREITTVHKIPFEYVNYRFDVKLTVDTSSMEIVANRSVSEIVDAFNAGYAIYAIARINEMSAVYNLCRVQNNEVVFSQCYTKVIDDYEYNITETMTLNSESNNVTYKQVAVKPSVE